ncbi:MAG: TIM barrel protein [Rhodospirillales bacterium]|nr:TIM barrel protein [Rhodospirillales bacterium]
MPRLAANLSTMFTELPFLERFGAAAACGFRAVEFLFPYAESLEAVAEAKRAAGVGVALFNLPAGDFAAEERGMAALAGRDEDFQQSLETALPYARALDARRLHVMAGIAPSGSRRHYIGNLRKAADFFQPYGIGLTIEPINRRDMPGYHLSYQADAISVLDEVGRQNLRLQMDFYHCQIMEGDLLRRLEANLSYISHIQIAGVPDRCEPDSGEVSYERLLPKLDSLGYAGWVGCEYRPRARTADGLAWAAPYGIQAPAA